MTAQKGQVQAHAQGRVLAGEGHGFLEGGLVHHQAGGGENALAVGADHGLVDGGRTAEIVGVDDQAARGIRSWRLVAIIGRHGAGNKPQPGAQNQQQSFGPCSGASVRGRKRRIAARSSLRSSRQ